MLKILIYDTNYVKGISRVIPLIKIKDWKKNNCQITVLTTTEGKEFYNNQIKGLKYIIFNFKYKIKSEYHLIWEIIKINFLVIINLKKLINKFDIVYSQSSVIDFLFVPFLLKLFDRKINWFVMVDNIVPPPSKRPGPFLKKLIPYLSFLIGRFLLKKADGIFVVVDYLKDYFNKLGMKNVIKTNNGYGIQTSIFKGSIAPNTSQINTLYAGRLHIAKGIFDLIKVVGLIVKRNKDFKIGILGDGDEKIKNDFYENIKESSLENNFIHFGYLEGKKKGNIFRNCDFYLSLSYDESFGHSILEALACNKQVIAYDLPVYYKVFKKYIQTGQLKLFKLKDFDNIARFILTTNFSKKRYFNKLEDYRWDTITKNELKAMRESVTST